MGFDFLWPWAALIFPLPLLVYLFWRRRVALKASASSERVALLHPSLGHLRLAYGGRAPGAQPSGLGYWAILALIWCGLVLALMQPRWLEPLTETRTPGYDLLLAVDTSHSMEALDFSVDGRQVSRMSVIKGVMGRFIDGREGDRIGLVIFGSQAYVMSPLSLDRQAVRNLLDSLVPSVAGQGTAIGDGIALGVKKLRDRPQGSRVMVLIADGENTSGLFQPVQAARLAAQEGIRIYVIGVGSNQKNVPIIENGRLITRDDLGFDEDTLRRIAEASGGTYFRGTDTRALEEIYRRIDTLEKTEAETRTVWVPHPLFRWPLALAALGLLLFGIFPEGRIRMLRWRR